MRRSNLGGVTNPKDPSWYWDPSARHQSRYFDGTSWTAYVADDGIVATDAEGVEDVLRSQRRQRRVRRVVFWLVGATGVLAVLVVGVLWTAADQVDEAGRPLVKRVEQVHAHLEERGLECRNLSVSGPAFGASESAVGTCRLDEAHGNEEVLIVAPPNVEGVEGPAVVGPDWYIELLRSDDKATLRDIATRLNARCVNCNS